MKVFVVNISDQRWEKYSKDPRYTRFKGVDGNKELDPDWVDHHYHFRYNCSRRLRMSIAGCSESHIKVLKHIRDNKLDNCIIIEDDTLLDFSRINELNNVDDFCYIGGQIKSLKLKDEKIFIRPEIKDGFQTINKEEYRVSGAFGYYIPNHLQTGILLTHSYCKRRGIDCEFMLLQKKNVLKKFIYPAIVRLYMPDAVNGFSNPQMKLKNDLLYY